MTDDWWLMTDDWWLPVTDAWWLMAEEWWLMMDDWWLMTDDWWLMADDWKWYTENDLRAPTAKTQTAKANFKSFNASKLEPSGAYAHMNMQRLAPVSSPPVSSLPVSSPPESLSSYVLIGLSSGVLSSCVLSSCGLSSCVLSSCLLSSGVLSSCVLSPCVQTQKTSESLSKNIRNWIKPQKRTRRYANNPGNLPGPDPIAPMDKISRAGEPLTPIRWCQQSRPEPRGVRGTGKLWQHAQHCFIQ